MRKFELMDNDEAIFINANGIYLEKTITFVTYIISLQTQTFNFVRKSPHLSKFGGFLSHSLFKLWYMITISFNDAMFFTCALNIFLTFDLLK